MCIHAQVHTRSLHTVAHTPQETHTIIHVPRARHFMRKVFSHMHLQPLSTLLDDRSLILCLNFKKNGGVPRQPCDIDM